MIAKQELCHLNHASKTSRIFLSKYYYYFIVVDSTEVWNLAPYAC
jgi:hypothetical protein